MSIKTYALAAFVTLSAYSASAQHSLPHDSRVTSVGEKQLPAAEITPYQSREAALTGNPTESSFALQPGEWERSETADAVQYTTRIKIPRAWEGRRLFFRIENVSSSFEVIANGTFVGYSQAGMGRSEFDFTNSARQDYNNIAVRIFKNAAAEKIENNRNHAAPAFGQTLVYTQPDVRVRDIAIDADPSNGYFSLDVMMKSRLLNTKDYLVSYELIAPDGQTAAQGQQRVATSSHSNDTVRFSAMITDPRRWNHETPHLYTLVIKTVNEGRTREVIPFRVGFRKAGYKGGRFTIDGNPIRLTAAKYSATSRDKAANDIAALRKSGVNLLITNAPQPGYFYDICDALGMYVCATADINTSEQPQSLLPGGNPSNDPAWKNAYVDRAEALWHASAPHPSVVIFSPATAAMNGYCLYESFMALKSLDKQRPVVYADAGGQWNNDRVEIAAQTEKVRPTDAVTFDKTKLRDTGKLTLHNNLEATPLTGKMTVKAAAGRKTIMKTDYAINIQPGGEFMLDLPMDFVTNEALKNRNVSVEISVQRGSLRHNPALNDAPKPTIWKGTFADLRTALTDTDANHPITFIATGETDI